MEGTPSPEGRDPEPGGEGVGVEWLKANEAFPFLWAGVCRGLPTVAERTPPLIVLVLEVASPLCDLQLSSSGSCTTMRDLDVPKETGFDFSLDVMKRH